MIHEGDVTLPDGRIVHGRVAVSYERDTNAVNILHYDLSWFEGEELTADEYNEDLGNIYLHEFVVDKLMLVEPYYKDID